MSTLTAPPRLSFAEASDKVTAYLKQSLPMGFWAITEITEDRQVYLYVTEDAYGVEPGDWTPYADTFCRHVLAGATPQIAPDAMTVPEYANARVNEKFTIGSYVGVPIFTSDGEVFGTICGLDPKARNDDLLGWAPGLRLLADLLSRVLESENLQAEAERRAAEMSEAAAALARSEEMYRLLVSTSQDLVCRASPSGKIWYASPVSETMLGWAPSELVGLSANEIAHPDDKFVEDEDGFIQDRMRTTHRGRHRAGHWIWLESNITLLRDQHGEMSEILITSRDITERRAQEAASHQESKLESLGRLSAGLAHEINTPIQYVGDNARFLAEAFHDLLRLVVTYRDALDPETPVGWADRLEVLTKAEAGLELDYLQHEVPSAIDQTLSGIDRVATIVRAMKTFSHPGHEKHVPADLNEALAASVTVTRHQVQEVAELTLDLGPLPPVVCNVAELNQVFLNLIVNAADAVADTGVRGLITIKSAVEGSDALVCISDSGGGIDDGILEKIFDPFFTTKGVGRGTGQGLAMARDVVQDGHGGSLTVTTTPGVGSAFAIRLPIDPPAV